MSKFRFVIFLNNTVNPIIMSEESSESKQTIQENVEKIFASKKLVKLVTATDCLIVRPSCISAFLIEECYPRKANDSTHDKSYTVKEADEPQPKKTEKAKSDYEQKLTLK